MTTTAKMAKAAKKVDMANLTASQEEMPPPGLGAGMKAAGRAATTAEGRETTTKAGGEAAATTAGAPRRRRVVPLAALEGELAGRRAVWTAKAKAMEAAIANRKARGDLEL